MRRFVARVHQFAPDIILDVAYLEPERYSSLSVSEVPRAVEVTMGGRHSWRGRRRRCWERPGQECWGDGVGPWGRRPRGRNREPDPRFAAFTATTARALTRPTEQSQTEADVVVFTPSVQVLGTVVLVSITVATQVNDGIQAAMGERVLCGVDPAGVQFVGPGRGVSGSISGWTCTLWVTASWRAGVW